MPTSLALHLALAFLLLVRLPEHSPPGAEESIDVELVAPAQAEKKTAKDRNDPVPEQARRQPRAFESASARAEKEQPKAQLPPAAPKAVEKPRPTPAQPRAATVKTENTATGAQAESRKALAELRVEPENATSGTADAAAPQAIPVPAEKPMADEARADEARKPEEAGSERQAPRLQQAREIYSKDALSDPRVQQAIGRLPPKQRIVQLCGIEALEQVRRQRPGAFPDMLAPAGGVVSASGLSVDGGAFRSRASWYEIDFKCEVNAETTAIVSFSFAIGKAIPESEWAARELPRE